MPCVSGIYKQNPGWSGAGYSGSVSGTYDRKERSGLGYSFIGFDKTGHKFIFVMDEWDAVFHMSFITERDRENYFTFF